MGYFLIILITFIITSFFGYISHWALHQPWTGDFSRSHLTHHLKLYPHTNFLSNSYRNAKSDNSIRFFAIMAIPLYIIPILFYLFKILSIDYIIIIYVVELITGLLHNYLHEFFHIRNHWLTKYNWFNKLVKLHYTHHLYMNKNYGIFIFSWDRLFKTFSK